MILLVFKMWRTKFTMMWQSTVELFQSTWSFTRCETKSQNMWIIIWKQKENQVTSKASKCESRSLGAVGHCGRQTQVLVIPRVSYLPTANLHSQTSLPWLGSKKEKPVKDVWTPVPNLEAVYLNRLQLKARVNWLRRRSPRKLLCICWRSLHKENEL